MFTIGWKYFKLNDKWYEVMRNLRRKVKLLLKLAQMHTPKQQYAMALTYLKLLQIKRQPFDQRTCRPSKSYEIPAH